VFKRYVFILAVVSAIGSASLEARERWTDQRDAQFGFSYSFPSDQRLQAFLRAFDLLAGDGRDRRRQFLKL
jgi:hypothetical protein